MSLPILERPVYQTTILSSPKPVEFVPFTVKESKILMMAKESDKPDDMVSAINQILANCLVDKTINVKELPLVDLEWLFLQIIAKSSGEKIPLIFKCTNEVEGKECGMLLEFELNLEEVEIFNKEVNKRIMITDKVGIIMKLPTFEMTKALFNTTVENVDQKLAAICVDQIFDSTSVYQAKNATPEELVEFIESLPVDKYEQVQQFFEKCPTIKQIHKTKCPKCGYDHTIELEGLEAFFE